MFTKEQVNKFVWWIPFKSFRDFFREYFYSIIDIQVDIKKNHINISNDIYKLNNSHLNLNEKLNSKLKFIMEQNNLITIDEIGTVIIRIDGGLTNQILLYASGTYIKKNYNRKIKFDISSYGENINRVRNSNRNFELLNISPNLEFEIANNNEIDIYKEVYGYNLRHQLKNNTVSYKSMNEVVAKYKNLYTLGLPRDMWENLISVIDTVRESLNLDKNILPEIKADKKNFEYYKKITTSKCSVAIHIRRGDYVEFAKRNKREIPSENYFINSIEHIKSILTPPRYRYRY